MKRLVLAAALAVSPLVAFAQTPNPIVGDIVDAHILPRFQALAGVSGLLATTAQNDCDSGSESLHAAYDDAFTAWVSASHLRFGPTEVDDRAFALAFWPDSRGATPRSLATLIADQDPVAASPDDYAHVSIAARGFYAMEFLLFDDTLKTQGDANYRCTLIQTMAADIAATSTAILQDWTSDYRARLLAPSATGTYHSDDEVLQELFKALTTGLQFTSDTRLGRPLGTFDRPRPKRAEVWRSARSADHVRLNLVALDDLAKRLAGDHPALANKINASFAQALKQLDAMDDPAFAGVADQQGRFKLELLQQSIDTTRALVRDELGPTLGVASGFNALDGD